MNQFYILIPALILVGCVAARTLIRTKRKHAEQRQIQRVKWPACFDEVRKRFHG